MRNKNPDTTYARILYQEIYHITFDNVCVW